MWKVGGATPRQNLDLRFRWSYVDGVCMYITHGLENRLPDVNEIFSEYATLEAEFNAVYKNPLFYFLQKLGQYQIFEIFSKSRRKILLSKSLSSRYFNLNTIFRIFRK